PSCLHLCPPLFPYTTLFRSVVFGLRNISLGICVNPVSIFCLEKLFISFLSFQHLIQLLVYIKPAICKMIFLVKAIHSYLMLFCVMISAQDRKSTRLNSSHVSISYAVFCLKK